MAAKEASIEPAKPTIPLVEVKPQEQQAEAPKPEAKAKRTKQPKTADKENTDSLKKSTIETPAAATAVTLNQNNANDDSDLTESLIRDAVETKVEDEWIPSKSTKKVR